MSKEEEIRASIANIDTEVLKDTLAILLAKDTITPTIATSEIRNNYKNFAQAILDLKNKYKFPELDFFTTEADLVYVQAGDRRVLLTDKTVIPEIPKPENNNPPHEINEEKDSVENAFENIKPNDSRFSRLEF